MEGQGNTAFSSSILPAKTSSRKSFLRNEKTRLRDLRLRSDAEDRRKRMGVLIFRRLRRKMEFLRNPRNRRAPIISKALQLHIWRDSNGDYSTLPEPPSVVFDGYEICSTYTAQLRVLNVSNWSQSIRIGQPTTHYFHVSSDDTRLHGAVLRPGQSCKFSVIFFSSSRSKVEDFITVRCEACAITLVLVARNPFPWVELPSTVNIGACIVGHHLPFNLSLSSLGAGASYKLFMNDDPVLVHGGLLQTHDVLKGHDFLIYPTRFHLQKDESGDIIILFIPSSPGKFVLDLKVVTECGAEWGTQVIGYGVNVHVSVEESLSGQGVTELGFGHATVSSMNSHRMVLVKNLMPVPIRFYWRITDNATIQSVGDKCFKLLKAAFVVDPLFGVIDAESDISFTFTFNPEEILFYNQKASLYIDTQRSYPLQTVIWKNLKEMLDYPEFSECDVEIWAKELSAADNCTGDRETLANSAENAGYVINVAEINLSGFAEPLQELVPPLLQWPDVIQQGQSHSAIVTLKNNSCVNVFFCWRIPDVTDFDKVNHFSVTPLKGQVNAMDQIELQVCFKARSIGRIQEKLICEIMRGPNLVLYIEGSIQGSHLQLSPTFLDFGIVQVGRNASSHFTITNKTAYSVSYNLFIAPIQQKTADDHSKRYEETVSWEEIRSRNKLSKTKFQERNGSTSMDASGIRGNVSLEYTYVLGEKVVHQRTQLELSLFPPNGTIPPKGSVDVEVILSPLNNGNFRWAITCEILGEELRSLYAVVNAFAAAPDARVSPPNFDLGIVYLDLTLQNRANLQNLCVLPAEFQWLKDEVNDSSAVFEFLPKEGVLSPFGVEEVTINVIPKMLGENKLVVLCNILGMLHPIQLTFRFYVLDIFCSYHVGHSLNFCNKNHCIRSIDRTKLPVIDFGKKQSLGVLHCVSVTLQNETGISGKIHASIGKYDVKPFLLQNQIVELATMCCNHNMAVIGILDNISQHSKYCYFTENVPANTVQKLLSSACRKVDQGIAVFLSAYEGIIEAWKSWHCDVYCFGCMPGTYKDIICFKVGDNCNVQIPITITLVGSPLSLSDHHLCPQDFGPTEESRVIVLKWISRPVGGPPRSRKFWVTNSANRPIELEWEKKEQVLSSGEACIKVDFEVDDESKIHLLMLGDPDKGPIQLKFEVEERTSVRVTLTELFKPVSYDSPFQIEPMKQLIPARGNALFTVVFSSVDVGRFCINLIGKTNIDELLFKARNVGTTKNDVNKSDCLHFYGNTISIADSLYVRLEAAAFPPILNSSLDDEKVEFYFLATGPPSQSSSSRKISLSNDYDYDLVFSITLSAPFFVVKAYRSSDHVETQFSCDALSDITLPPKYMLILQLDFMLHKCDDITIENDLIISFSNKFYQKLPMIGHVEFPKVLSYIESILFGPVLIGSSLTIPFTIMNKGRVDAKWQLEKKCLIGNCISFDGENHFTSLLDGQERGPSKSDMVFTFDTYEGLLKGLSTSSSNNQIINVTFSPQEKRLYNHKIYIEVFRGHGITILLEGQGVVELPSNLTLVEPPSKKKSWKKRLVTTK